MYGLERRTAVVRTDIATGVISPDLAAIPFGGRRPHESQDLGTKIQAFFGSRLLKLLLWRLRPGEGRKNGRVKG
jgi:hypothetical protein